MPYNEDLDRLVALAGEWESQPAWVSYVQYLRLRGGGVRAEALKSLHDFIDRVASWTFEDRLAFAEPVLAASRKFQDTTVLLPQPLHASVLVPTLKEWSGREPQNPQALLWLGLLRCDDPSEYLKRALDLDPSLALARETLVDWILGDVEYNQHHLPPFYIHDPREDLKALDEADNLVDGLVEAVRVDAFRNEVKELRARAREWLAAHPREGDFADH